MKILSIKEAQKEEFGCNNVYINVRTLLNRRKPASESLKEVNTKYCINVPVLPFVEEAIYYAINRNTIVRKKLLEQGKKVKPLDEISILDIAVTLRHAILDGSLFLGDILLEKVKNEYQGMELYKERKSA